MEGRYCISIRDASIVGDKVEGKKGFAKKRLVEEEGALRMRG